MPNFAVKQTREYKTAVKAFKLLRDDKCLYYEFVEEIETDKNLEKEYYEFKQ